MSLLFDFEEDYNSRPTSITNTSFNQEFIFHVCGNFLEEALVDDIYGPDDDLLALEAAYIILPPWRRVPLYDGNHLFLVLVKLNVTRIAPDVWKLEVGYGPPEFGGSGAGGYSQPQNVGPNVGEQNWTDRFVQVSVNSEAITENKKLSLRTIACQKAVGAANQTVPYPSGKPAPIGWTIDEVAGSDVFVRSFEFSLTAYFRPDEYNFAYVRRLYRMATLLNHDTFCGFPAESVLFLGHSAAGDVYSLIPVTFNFAMKPNFKLSQTEATVLMDPNEDDPAKMFDRYYEPYFPDAGGTAPGGALSGWSEIDYSYLPVPDENTKMVLQKPILRTIHVNYEKGNYDRFNI